MLHQATRKRGWSTRLLLSGAALLALAAAARPAAAEDEAEEAAERGEVSLPTGQRITPLAAPRAVFEQLDPEIPGYPSYRAGQPISTAVSPDRKTLLVLTSGYNLANTKGGATLARASQEYVFVYDIARGRPVKRQVLQVPNTFAGIAFAPDGRTFHVSGGKDDNVHTFSLRGDRWAESGAPIRLGHESGLGFYVGEEPLAAGGLAVTANGRQVVVANVYNDSLSVVDLKARRKVREIELRPGKQDPAQRGVPGGEYPFWVVTKGENLAYVSSLRDREVVLVSLAGEGSVLARIKVEGNPNKMILNRDGSLLFVAEDNSDRVSVVDTRTNRVVTSVRTTAPEDLLAEGLRKYNGSTPNSLALSPDEGTLYVTNGNTNSVAVIRRAGDGWRVAGLVPVGWYPNAVSLSGDGRTMYVLNGKDPAGPNPKLDQPEQNQYILQLEKGGLLTLPVPAAADLEQLSRQVAANNGFRTRTRPEDERVMAALRQRIKHVIYIIKENRTYDQILGDLDRGNGDPSLTMFGEAITPNLHRLARKFVTLDNFFVSGEVSGNGWPWSTAARESDFGTKAVPLNYAGRGTNYEYEGQNRDLNVGLATLAERKRANPETPDDPDLLPGTANVAAPDGPEGAPAGKGYLWDAVLREGLTIREYGCMSDLAYDAPREPQAFAKKVVQSRPANPELFRFGDPYFRGYDPGYPDFWRQAEWEREFAQYEVNGKLPALSMVQFPVDHMGNFDTAISGVNTPETQQADNDYATGKLVERVATSKRYQDSTLIFVIEDDAQDGPDHVDAHRSTAYVVGPYVKQGAVVSNRFTTVNMVRTIEDVLGLDHLNLNTASQRPMTELFDLDQKEWSFKARPAEILYTTELPLPHRDDRAGGEDRSPVGPIQPAAWWASRTAGFDFSGEDRLDAAAFNRLLWEGLMGGRPYPVERSGADFRLDRRALLAWWSSTRG